MQQQLKTMKPASDSSKKSCAAWSARTSRSRIRTPSSRATCASRCASRSLDFLVQRYGDFVRYEPPFKASTALLWLGPFLLLAAGATTLLIVLRRRRNAPEAPALGPDEKRLVERVLGPPGSGKDAR